METDPAATFDQTSDFEGEINTRTASRRKPTPKIQPRPQTHRQQQLKTI